MPRKLLSPSIPSKPFKDTHGEQISLVRSFDWLDISALDGIADEYYDLLSTSQYIDPVRRDTLCDALDRRVELLRELQNKR